MWKWIDLHTSCDGNVQQIAPAVAAPQRPIVRSPSRHTAIAVSPEMRIGIIRSASQEPPKTPTTGAASQVSSGPP
jgi:hypothetical protein